MSFDLSIIIFPLAVIFVIAGALSLILGIFNINLFGKIPIVLWIIYILAIISAVYIALAFFLHS